MSKEKIGYIELLRVLSMLSVVMLHIASTAWYYVEKNTIEWHIYNIMRCTCKWGVTVFVMISGTLFLHKRHISMATLWGKYIKRIAIILVFWSFAYAIFPLLKIMVCNGNIKNWDIGGGIRAFVLGENHLWYLYMCIGLYMMIPFMEAISKDKKILNYFIILSIAFSIVLPAFQKIPTFQEGISNQFINKFSIQMGSGYLLYFSLGYFWTLNEKIYKASGRYALYVLAFIVYLISIYLTAKSDGKHFLVDGTMSIGNFIVTNAIFVFVINYSEKLKGCVIVWEWINKIASFSFGIYLVHMFFVRETTKYMVANFNNPWIVVGVTMIIVLGGVFGCVLCDKTDTTFT